MNKSQVEVLCKVKGVLRSIRSPLNPLKTLDKKESL